MKNNVKIVAIRSVNSEYEMYNIEFAQENEGASTSLSRRLKGIFANRKPKRVFQNFSIEFIQEIQNELEAEGTKVDLLTLVDVDLSQDEHIDLPKSFNARIVTTEFLIGEEVPTYLHGGAFVHQDSISSDGNYTVREWTSKSGELETKQPKLIIDEETGDVTYFKKAGKNIYMERFLWIDGDDEKAREDKFIQHDKQSETSEAAKAMQSKLKENLAAKNKRARTTTN